MDSSSPADGAGSSTPASNSTSSNSGSDSGSDSTRRPSRWRSAIDKALPENNRSVNDISPLKSPNILAILTGSGSAEASSMAASQQKQQQQQGKESQLSLDSVLSAFQTGTLGDYISQEIDAATYKMGLATMEHSMTMAAGVLFGAALSTGIILGALVVIGGSSFRAAERDPALDGSTQHFGGQLASGKEGSSFQLVWPFESFLRWYHRCFRPRPRSSSLARKGLSPRRLDGAVQASDAQPHANHSTTPSCDESTNGYTVLMSSGPTPHPPSASTQVSTPGPTPAAHSKLILFACKLHDAKGKSADEQHQECIAMVASKLESYRSGADWANVRRLMVHLVETHDVTGNTGTVDSASNFRDRLRTAVQVSGSAAPQADVDDLFALTIVYVTRLESKDSVVEIEVMANI